MSDNKAEYDIYLYIFIFFSPVNKQNYLDWSFKMTLIHLNEINKLFRLIS